MIPVENIPSPSPSPARGRGNPLPIPPRCRTFVSSIVTFNVFIIKQNPKARGEPWGGTKVIPSRLGACGDGVNRHASAMDAATAGCASAIFEFDDPRNVRENGVVFAAQGVPSCRDRCAPLTNDDVTGVNLFTTKTFDAESLAGGIPPVGCGSL